MINELQKYFHGESDCRSNVQCVIEVFSIAICRIAVSFSRITILLIGIIADLVSKSVSWIR